MTADAAGTQAGIGARTKGGQPPPPTVWQPVPGVDGVWHAERETMRVPLRATAIRLADRRLAIYSPIRGLGDEAHRVLTDVGRPALLVAPNHFHNMGLGEYAAAYPDVSIVGSAAAIPRLKRKCNHDVSDESPLRDALPATAKVLVPPATRNGELWLSVATASGRAWIVGDGFFNIARTPRTPMGLLVSMLGISPGLRIGSTFRWLMRDRARYKRWLLDTITNEPPTMLIPCHGDILLDPTLPDRLRRLAETRL